MLHTQQAHFPVRLLTRINCLRWVPERGLTPLLPPLWRRSLVAPRVIYGHVSAGGCLQVGNFATGHLCLG